MSLERRNQLVEIIVQMQPQLGAFLNNVSQELSFCSGSWDLRAYGFERAFETLWDHAVLDQSGLLLEPLLMLWRQSVELSLKSAIMSTAGVIGGRPGHDLALLFRQLCTVRARRGFSDDCDVSAKVQKAVELVQSLDPQADRLRYPRSRSGESFGGIDADLDTLFQAHWIITTYCDGAALEAEHLGLAH